MTRFSFNPVAHIYTVVINVKIWQTGYYELAKNWYTGTYSLTYECLHVDETSMCFYYCVHYTSYVDFMQDDREKESPALTDQHDQLASDAAEKPLTFLHRLQLFKAEFEEIKVYLVCTHKYIGYYQLL